MGHHGNEAVARRYWDAMSAGDFDAARRELHPEFEGYWPQSGERIRGPENWLGIARTHPRFPAITPVQHLVEGEMVVTHARFDYSRDGSPPYQICAVQRFRERKIVSALEFFGPPFEAAAWREHLVERT